MADDDWNCARQHAEMDRRIQARRAWEADQAEQAALDDPVGVLVDRFIAKWVPQHYPHLVDTDDNDGQRLREALRAVVDAEKADTYPTETDYDAACKSLWAALGRAHKAEVDLARLQNLWLLVPADARETAVAIAALADTEGKGQ